MRGPRGNPALLPKIGRCVSPRSFTFALHRPGGSRVVQVYAYVNGRRVLHRRGRDIRRITIHGLPAGRRFTLRIEVFAANGAETIGMRRYMGCRKKRHRHPPPDRDTP